MLQISSTSIVYYIFDMSIGVNLLEIFCMKISNFIPPPPGQLHLSQVRLNWETKQRRRFRIPRVTAPQGQGPRRGQAIRNSRRGGAIKFEILIQKICKRIIPLFLQGVAVPELDSHPGRATTMGQTQAPCASPQTNLLAFIDLDHTTT